jgi:hypothetical protein
MYCFLFCGIVRFVRGTSGAAHFAHFTVSVFMFLLSRFYKRDI